MELSNKQKALGIVLSMKHKLAEMETVLGGPSGAIDWNDIYSLAENAKFEAEDVRELAYQEIEGEDL